MSEPKPSLPESIGAATLRPDRTLVLDLRATDETGRIGDAQFLYRPGEPRYDDIIRHVGGLEPGQSKPVPPWPDKK